MDLGAVTSALYSWWLYELCDVYLEVIKPIVRNGTPDQQAAARATLYQCLDEGLRLISPFMPFITEELFQRLPRRAGDNTESICVSSYPMPLSGRADATLDAAVAHSRGVLTALRNVAATYNVNLKSQQPQVTLAVTDDVVRQNLESLLIPMLAPTGLQVAKVLFALQKDLSKPPAGCAAVIIDHSTTMYVQLAGIVDAQKEIEKLEKKIEQQSKALKDLIARMASGDYKRVPEAVQQADAEKRQRIEQELVSLQQALATFRALGQSQ
jgi:valyl-tRNA synthetase